MSATDELRRMLDERGVEWESDDFSGIDRKVVYQYTYWGDGGGCCFCEPIGAEPGTLGAKCDFSVIGFTPEQAIAATLGAGTCRMEPLPGSPGGTVTLPVRSTEGGGMSEYVTAWADDLPGMTHGEEIVRCRDCAKAECPEVHLLNGMKRHILTCVRFPSFQHETQPDGFCAWGERRDA